MKQKDERTGSPARPFQRIEVWLDAETIRLAQDLGDDDLALGIRRAVVLAGKRQFIREHLPEFSALRWKNALISHRSK